VFDKSQTRPTAIVTQGKDEHRGPALVMYEEFNEGAGVSPLLQSTHLWTGPHDTVAAHHVNRYNRVGERPSCRRSPMQMESTQREMRRS
jgi:hypothetical protein